MKKTNASRLLEKANIKYRLIEYTFDEKNLGGIEVCEKIGMEAKKVFKTLVTKSEKNDIYIFCIPISHELNLKKAGSISGSKKLEMVLMKDVLKITGYLVGACSPVGMKKAYPTYIDDTALSFEEVGVSGGKRGVELILNPKDLCNYINGTFTNLI